MTRARWHVTALIAATVLAACASAPQPAPEPQPQRYSGELLQWFEGQSFRADGETAPWAFGMSPEAMRELAQAYPEGYAPGPMPTIIVADVEGVLRPVHPDAHRYGAVGGRYDHYLTITRVHSARLLRSACEPISTMVFFGTNETALNAAALELLDAAVRQTRRGACNVSRVSVVGHTDTVGAAAHNLALSEQRASVVRDALVAGGVPGALVTTEGAGEARPLRHTPDNVPEPLNRHVKITIEAPTGDAR
jgi:outer membrane protein OmpA-like peptidoglycan-associated protein